METPKPCPGKCTTLLYTDVAKSDAAEPTLDPFLSRKVRPLSELSWSWAVTSRAWSVNLDMKLGSDPAFASSSSDIDMLSELLSEPMATEKEVGQAEEEPSKTKYSHSTGPPGIEGIVQGRGIRQCCKAYMERCHQVEVLYSVRVAVCAQHSTE